jgi:hypothetical protein
MGLVSLEKPPFIVGSSLVYNPTLCGISWDSLQNLTVLLLPLMYSPLRSLELKLI